MVLKCHTRASTDKSSNLHDCVFNIKKNTVFIKFSKAFNKDKERYNIFIVTIE